MKHPGKPVKGFNAVKVFSATRGMELEALGERVSEWIAATRCSDVEIVVAQSSDAQFHCLTIVVFYRV